MTGYTRADSVNNIADGNIINASDLDGEFDAVQAAFNNSTGHVHDGTAANGAPITKIGPTQDVVASAIALLPKTTATVDVGSSSLKFKDFFFSGAGSVTGTITAGGFSGPLNGTVGATTPAAGTFTSLTDSGNLTFTGTGNRITGDFSNATVANRVTFQTSTTNGNTIVPFIPNGSATQTNLILYNSSDVTTNFSLFTIRHNATASSFASSIGGTGTYVPITFETGGSERMRLDTSGNVGIGTSSPSTSGKLTVNGNVVFGGPSGRNTATSNYIGVWTTGDPVDDARANIGFTTVAGAASSSSYITFSTNSYGVSGGERMRIDSSGNVGIGTSSPNAKIDVQQNQAALSYLFDTYNSTNGGGSIWRMITRNIANTGTTSVDFYKPSASGFYINNNDTNAGAFTAFGIGGTERMRIDSSGNVLVTNPAGLGYGTGSGGTVTQATSKSTSVTLNKPTGQITMNAAALAAGTSVFFDVNDSLVAATDNILLTLSNFSALNYTIKCFVSTGKFTVILKNETAGSLSEAVVFNFGVLKGATA